MRSMALRDRIRTGAAKALYPSAVALLAILLAGCFDKATKPKETTPPVVPPGYHLPTAIDSVLYNLRKSWVEMRLDGY